MTNEAKATEIPLPDSNLSIRCGRDGTWLTFSASTGRSASLCIDALDKGRGIIDGALRDWCADQQKRAGEIRDGQLIEGAK